MLTLSLHQIACILFPNCPLQTLADSPSENFNDVIGHKLLWPPQIELDRCYFCLSVNRTCQKASNVETLFIGQRTDYLFTLISHKGGVVVVVTFHNKTCNFLKESSNPIKLCAHIGRYKMGQPIHYWRNPTTWGHWRVPVLGSEVAANGHCMK